MNRTKTLELATAAVAQRATPYGTPENNFERIARRWNAHLQNAGLDGDLTPVDVALMLSDVKAARIESDPKHLDSWVDMAGYAACGAEVSKAGESEVEIPTWPPPGVAVGITIKPGETTNDAIERTIRERSRVQENVYEYTAWPPAGRPAIFMPDINPPNKPAAKPKFSRADIVYWCDESGKKNYRTVSSVAGDVVRFNHGGWMSADALSLADAPTRFNFKMSDTVNLTYAKDGDTPGIVTGFTDTEVRVVWPDFGFHSGTYKPHELRHGP